MTEDRNPGMKHFDALPIEQKLCEAADYWENHFRGYSAMPSYVACFREGATEIKRLWGVIDAAHEAARLGDEDTSLRILEVNARSRGQP